MGGRDGADGATGRLEVHLFGPVGVVIDGVRVDLGARRQRATFAVLALSAGAVVSVERMIDCIWGEAPPPTAKNALQVYVGGLRHALGPAVIRTVEPGYVLDVPRDSVDVLRFERLVDEQSFAEAVSLWTAEPLSDLAELAFAAAVVTRLRELRLRSIEGWFEQRLEAGDHDAVSGEVGEVLADAPFRERLWRQLMVAHYRCGRQADALAAFQRARQILGDELGIDPGPALVALETAVLAQDPALDAPVSRTRAGTPLPAVASPTLGRDRDLATIEDSLRDHRLTTLLGPGGVGKTRLALEAAHAAGENFEHGVVWIELAAIRDERGFRAKVATALGVASSPDDRSAIAAAIAGHQLLLVLDNLEQLPNADVLVAEVLGGSSGPRVLVTSRVPLRLQSEHVVRVDPLAPVDAARLLGERIAAVSGTEPDSGVVAELATRLYGFPLALELAAAGCRSASPRQVLELLDRRLPVVSRQADLPERHRTMQATVEWSLDLLDPDSRSVLSSLTPFRSPFSLTTALAHAGPEGATAQQFASLVEASLVRSRDDDYEVLPPVRDHLLGGLTPAELDALADRHAAWVVDTCAEAAVTLYSGDEIATRSRLLALLPDVRAAHDQLVRAGRPEPAARVVLDIAQVWFHAGRTHEAEARLAVVSDQPGLTERTSVELKAMRGCFRKMTTLDGAHELLVAGVIGLRRHAPDSVALVNALCHLADLNLDAGNDDEAVALADEAVATASRRVGDRGTVSVAWDLAGYVARGVGDRDRAIAAARAAVAEARRDKTGVLPDAIAGLAASLGPADAEGLVVAYEALTLTERPECRPTQRAKVITDVAEVIAVADPGEALLLLSEGVSTVLATSMRGDLATLLRIAATIVGEVEPVAAATLIGAVRRGGAAQSGEVDTIAGRLAESLGTRDYSRAAGAGAALDDDALSRFVAELAARLSETSGQDEHDVDHGR